MKRVLVILACSIMVLSSTILSNDPPTTQSSKGLLYSDSTMSNLRGIVSALNLKFSQCELSRTFVSLPVGQGHLVTINKNDINAAQAAINGGASFDEFCRLFPTASIERGHVVVYEPVNERNDSTHFKLVMLATGSYYFNWMSCARLQQADREQGRWIIGRTSGSEKSSGLCAFWITESIESKPLMDSYARMVQYVDCLVDTTSLIFKNDGLDDNPRSRKRDSEVDKLSKELNTLTRRPEYGSTEGDSFFVRLSEWHDKGRWVILDSVVRINTQLQQRLAGVAQDAVKTGTSNDDFEDYVARYVSRDLSLELKRHRKVYGQCSMDDSPRVHAFNIAVLAAETMKWEIFLRAHLDIMNDRFERITDGSYAQPGRLTYIRELEELDINVADLLLGSAISVDNAARNHYFGSIGRLGRAIAESHCTSDFEQRLLKMIADPKLDLLNRMRMYYLASNFDAYIKDKVHKDEFHQSIAEAVKSLPKDFQQRLEKAE